MLRAAPPIRIALPRSMALPATLRGRYSRWQCVGDLEDVRVRLQALPDASVGFVYELRVSVQKASDERFIGVGRPFAHSGQQSVRNIAVRSGPEMATLETVAFCVAHVAPQSAREEHSSVFLPFETAFEGRVPRLLQKSRRKAGSHPRA